MPRIIGPVPSDKWEKEVRKQLQKQLPDDWIVICNVSWALKNDSGFVSDGQADFVVLVPELGLAVVEVKGSKSVSVHEDGNWYREYTGPNGKLGEVLLKEAPPEQATRNQHTMAKIVKEGLGYSENAPFPGMHAWLVVYPNGAVKGKLDTYDPHTIVTKDHMHQLGAAIRSVLLDRGREGRGKKFTKDYANRSAELLTNQRFKIVAIDTELDVEENAIDIDELTRQQFAVLRGAFELPRVAIIGPAGSGKTLLAIWKLAALLEEGKKAIYVCFNTALAESLRTKHPSMSENIVNVDSLFWGIVDVNTRTGSFGNNFYTKVLPERVMDTLFSANDDDKYDAIIIDEGQDFGDDRIVALYQLLKDSDYAQWLYFADNMQDLYNQGTDETLGAEVTFRLYHNCRNTERVNAATNKVCSGEVKSMPGMPCGEVPKVSICKSELMAQRAWERVNELSPEGGAVILSPFKLENSCMNTSRKAYGLELTDQISKIGVPGFVFYSTIKSFKGLEARHVIFIHADKSGTNPALAEEDMYVAFTRATARLDILTANQEAMSWFTDKLELLS